MKRGVSEPPRPSAEYRVLYKRYQEAMTKMEDMWAGAFADLATREGILNAAADNELVSGLIARTQWPEKAAFYESAADLTHELNNRGDATSEQAATTISLLIQHIEFLYSAIHGLRGEAE